MWARLACMSLPKTEVYLGYMQIWYCTLLYCVLLAQAGSDLKSSVIDNLLYEIYGRTVNILKKPTGMLFEANTEYINMPLLMN